MKNNELLARIDERTRNIWRMVERLEKHQAEANGYIKENMKLSIKTAAWVTAIRWIMGIAIAGVITWLSHIEGFW